MTSLWTQIISGLGWVLYGSFFEWYWHKLWMHTPRPPRLAFHGHTVVHHGLYKGDESYFVNEDRHPEHILLKPYAFPLMVVAHLPIMWAIQRYLVPNTMAGGFIAVCVYFTIYEYAHWNMHVPRGHMIERFRWFQFLRQHHKLHHRYFQKNFCVLLPLADLVMGTLITEKSVARQKAEREAAIANGQVQQERGKRRMGRNRDRAGVVNSVGSAVRSTRSSPLATEFRKFKVRRRSLRRAGRVSAQHLRDLLSITRTRSGR